MFLMGTIMAQIIITIPDDKYYEYKKYFLMTYPNQTTDEKDPVHMTDDEWIVHKINLMAKNAYRKGKQAENDEQIKPVFDDNIISVTKK